MRGTCKWFNAQKGFGFITSEDGTDVFVHYTGIVSDKKFKALTEGDIVEFEVRDVEKGKQAFDVKVVESATGITEVEVTE